MKTFAKIILSAAVCASLANADRIQHQFEPPKDTSEFNGVEVDWDVDLTFTYQGLDQNYGSDIKSGLALPTANLDLNAKIMSGFNVKLETMLSSHHHHETYVKGGYATMDNLDWISKDFAKGFMDKSTIKVGVNDLNYGDYHFRRTDNADVMRNPFINNMGVEGYMQAGFIELTYRMPSINTLFVAGVSNGEVNPDDVSAGNGKGAYSYYAKLAYDNQISENTRFRISQSAFTVNNTTKNRLYMGDKAGNVPRKIFNAIDNTYNSPNDRDSFGAVWNAMAGYNDLTSTMTNVFYKYKDTEFFGLLEYADGKQIYGASSVPLANAIDMEMLHYSGEIVQRFGADKYYVAARYEKAELEKEGAAQDAKLTQYQIAAGMFLSKTAMMKIEYIKQERDHVHAGHDNVKFDGLMISAALSF
ncbi:hypothetical protein ACMC56_09995 [Campylobacterota bacterium DY0563]